MAADEEVKAPSPVDIFDQSLATEEIEINPDGNAFSFPPPPSETGNPYLVKIARGNKGWQNWPGKNGKPSYLVTDLKATIIAPGKDGIDGKFLFDNFVSTMVMTQDKTSRVQGILKAIYDSRGQGEKVPRHTSHKELAQLLQAEFDRESEVDVWIQWTAWCESCSTKDKRVEVKGENRFPQNADESGHLGEMEHTCGSLLSAQARITKSLARK